MTQFGQTNPWPECNTFVRSKVTQWSTRGQINCSFRDSIELVSCSAAKRGDMIIGTCCASPKLPLGETLICMKSKLGDCGIEKSHLCKWGLWPLFRCWVLCKMCGRACQCIHLAHLHEWDFSIPQLPKIIIIIIIISNAVDHHHHVC